LTDRATIERRTRLMLADGSGLPAHIVNLGHGIFPETPVDNAIAFVETVKAYRG
jgi:uroporphyrinogen decarboxylase